MAFKPLQSYYNSWSALTPESKVELLEKTLLAIDNETTKRVADFCLQILSGIAFERECEKHPILNKAVTDLTAKIHSKKCDPSELEYVGYLVNKKNPYLILGRSSIRDSIVIAESEGSRIDLDLSQETCMIMLTLFNMNQEMQSRSLENANSKEVKEIVHAVGCFKVCGWLNEAIKKEAKIRLRNDRKHTILQKIRCVKDEETLIEVYKDYRTITKCSIIDEYFLKLIAIQYSDHIHSLLCKEAIEMLEWYLMKTRKEVFDPSLSMKEESFCFAHAQLMNAAYEKNLMDVSLEIKKSLLNVIVFEKKESFSQIPLVDIFKTIDSIFDLLPENEELRLKLVDIIQRIPRIQRQALTDELLEKPYYLSDVDPLMIFLEDEIMKTGNGWELTHHLVSHNGVRYTIDLLTKLSCTYPKNTLKFAKTLLLWAKEHGCDKEETAQLILYFLSIISDSEFLTMLTRYIQQVIFDLDMDIGPFESFFDKIYHLRGAYSFLLPLCEYAVKRGNFSSAIQVANWDKKINSAFWNDMDSLDRILFAGKDGELEIIANLFVQNRLSDSVDISILFPLLAHVTKIDRAVYKKLFQMLMKSHSLRDLLDLSLTSVKCNAFHIQVIETLYDRLAFPQKGSMAYSPTYINAESASSRDIAVFLIDQGIPSSNEEKVRLMDFLVRAKLVMGKDVALPLFIKGILTTAERLWNDKYFDTANAFIEYFENTDYAILRLFISKVSLIHPHDDTFDKIFNLIFKYGHDDFVLKYLKSCKSYTSYQINLLNKFKASSALTKKPF